jgi:hypothetical protein
MRTHLLAAIAMAGLVGCVGVIDQTIPSNPPPGSTGDPGTGNGSAAAAARKSFEDNVYGIIDTKCVGCHSSAGPVGNTTGFVAGNKADAYVTATGYAALVGDFTPAGAPIMIKVTKEMHKGLSYAADEQQKISDWLNLELTARASGTGTGSGSGTTETPAQATERVVKEWSGCMTLANFTAANMIAWGNMQANNSACKTCHVDGEYGQIASDVAGPFFSTISTNRYYMAQYFSVQLIDPANPTAPFNPMNAKMIINTKSFTAVGTAQPPHGEHPRFTLQGSQGMAALQKYYDSTMAAKTAGTCGPSTLTN